MESENLKLSILMPVRNEGASIRTMLKMLGAIVEVPYEVLVVYDLQDDDTVGAVESWQSHFPNVRLIHNNFGRGVANAIKAGVDASKGKYVLLFAVDEMGPLLAIEDMISLMDRGCDLVSCTRYSSGGRRLGGSLVGRIISRAANNLFRIMAGVTFTDGTTGIKMFKKELFKKFTIESNPVGWAVVFEIMVKAQKSGMRIGEVPIISIDRLYGGKSTFALGLWIKEYLRWFIWGVKNLRGSKNREKVMVKIPESVIK